MFNIALPMFLRRAGLSSKIMVMLLAGYALINEPVIAFSIIISVLIIYLFTSKGNIIAALVNSNLVFWLITNLSCWYAWYPHSTAGFVECYYLALPFLLSAFIKSFILLFLMENAYKYTVKKFPFLSERAFSGANC
ncbi:MAG: hypothetical protein LBI01_02135 [Elusimicrobium sp.]|jgi:hypothetical protein|nr:hypothetical protein [Elusimicrobium sp.]